MSNQIENDAERVESAPRENGQMSYLQRSFSAEMVRSSHKKVFSSVLQWFIPSCTEQFLQRFVACFEQTLNRFLI
jgi:hypothetical protein